MRILRSLVVFCLLIWLFWIPNIMAQSTTNPPRALDALLQHHAFMAFEVAKTGIPYEGVVPSNLTGIKITAMRLRSGSLKRKGLTMYKEFEIPLGITVVPYVERLVLVYQNLGNWSSTYYPLQGYTYLTPVLGLLAYSAENLSATNLPELDIRVPDPNIPIQIRFSEVFLRSSHNRPVAKCIWFDLHGLANFSETSSGNVCKTTQQGHFAIVMESVASPPIPPRPHKESKKKKSDSKIWIIVGSVIGGLALFLLMVFLLLWMRKYKHKKRMQKMEKAADAGENLRMTTVGDTKAPSAMRTRTQPSLEE